MTTFLFVLSLLGKAGYQLQVADHTGRVIEILAVTVRTLSKPMFTDISTSFAQGVVDIEGKVAAACLDSGIQEEQILFLG